MDKIEEMLVGVTDAQITQYTPEPAPKMEGRDGVRVLMPLTDRLKRFYVLRQMAVERQKRKLLEFVHTVFKAVRPTLQPMLDALSKEELPEDVTADSFADTMKELGKQVPEIINELGSTETDADKFDSMIQEEFAKELQSALVAHLNTNPDGPTPDMVEHLERDVYIHDGEWVIAAERCACPGCKMKTMFEGVTAKPTEIPQEVLERILAEHPGSTLVTDVNELDLSSIDAGERENILSDLAAHLAAGDVVLDLGVDKHPRFALIDVQVGGIGIEMPDPELLAELLGDAFKLRAENASSASESPRRRRGGMAGWFTRAAGAH